MSSKLNTLEYTRSLVWDGDNYTKTKPAATVVAGNGLTFRDPGNVLTGIADIGMKVQIVQVDKGYPYGLSCTDCGADFAEGDVVLAGQQRLVGWIGWHTRCLKMTLDEAPLDEYEIIKQKLANGEDPFE